MKSWPSWDKDAAHDRIVVYAQRRGGLLPALHALQNYYGCLSQDSIDLAADVFNFSRAEVYGVARYYDDFRARPSKLPVLKVCMGEACQAVGAVALKDHALEHASATVEIEEVFCLGNCACGPSIISGSAVHGRMTSERLDAAVRQLEGEGI